MARAPRSSHTHTQGVIPDEIAEAYGRKGVTKLVNVLGLPASDLSDEKRAHALRVLIGLLTTQEQKVRCVHVHTTHPSSHDLCVRVRMIDCVHSCVRRCGAIRRDIFVNKTHTP
jgi:hypothetical protein